MWEKILSHQSELSQELFIVPVMCKGAPHGRSAKLVRALGREELIRAAQEIRWDGQAQCLLLALPKGEKRMAVMDLETCAEALEAHAQKVVAPYDAKGRFACGDCARCQLHLPTLEREALTHFNQLLSQAQSADSAVEMVFRDLPSRDRHLVQRWATHADPEYKHRPIRHAQLAKEFGITERQVTRILKKAKTLNGPIFRRLLQLRKDRATLSRAHNYTERR